VPGGGTYFLGPKQKMKKIKEHIKISNLKILWNNYNFDLYLAEIDLFWKRNHQSPDRHMTDDFSPSF